MSNILWKSLVVSPAVLGATLLVSGAALASGNSTTPVVIKTEVSQAKAQEASATTFSTIIATETIKAPQTLAQAQQTPVNVLEQVNQYSNEGKNNNSQGQVTSVSQFSDVQPTDWAFQALQSLVERYGCIAGYPNGTFRGNRAMTRYEFAAGLNACLDRVNELIATATADLVKKEDLATLQRLQEEFSAELATLRGRVDALEARTAELESNQFSTTTKLVGEAIFALSDVFGDRAGNANNTVFQNRVRLDLQSSFTGRDVLHTRLAAGNASQFDLGSTTVGGIPSGEGLQTFNINGTTTNSVNLDWLAYYVPIGPAQLYVSATGGTHSDYAATNNPYFEDYDGGNGALSTFASRNPIYNIGGGAGAALNIPFGKPGGILKPSSITVGYLGSEPNNPGLGTGIFNGNYAALGQLNFSLGDRVALAATYVHGYHGAGSALFDEGGYRGSIGLPVVGTAQANALGVNRNNNLPNNVASASDSYGLSAAFRPSDKLSVSGYVSYHDVTGFGSNDDFEAWSYGAGIALPDFGKKGNVLGIFGGSEPYSLRAGASEQPYHVEGFYKYRVSDNISITPGVIYLTNLGQQSGGNNEAWIGTLRTTFTF
ncbi:MAG: iron uptake porin [Cyanomargarita calcarea GSE-NOS-MK-12-04C]|uniref:Iron uptake porin n=1 Tax=Cyanomargarita calcarea GSE-NOS-MK-12-04C TaxID=2839659 RepID=A0A951UWU6_9CYAN|nr:iron uptake porin [Cyanomargarita calcarea GSE-NOS-MK-12-04C]